MLLAFLVGSLGFVLAAWLVSRVALRVMAALGLELLPVLLWLGLAEDPLAVPRDQRRRLGELLGS